MENKNMYMSYIIKVISSCETLDQIVNAKNWALKVCKKLKRDGILDYNDLQDVISIYIQYLRAIESEGIC